jgi:hypothetical protein
VGTEGTPVNPRVGTGQALADAVILALRSGDLVAARAAARALETFVEVLSDSERHAVSDIGAKRRNREGKTGEDDMPTLAGFGVSSSTSRAARLMSCCRSSIGRRRIASRSSCID